MLICLVGLLIPMLLLGLLYLLQHAHLGLHGCLLPQIFLRVSFDQSRKFRLVANQFPIQRRTQNIQLVNTRCVFLLYVLKKFIRLSGLLCCFLSLAGVVLLTHIALEGLVSAYFNFLALNRDLVLVGKPLQFFGRLFVLFVPSFFLMLCFLSLVASIFFTAHGLLFVWRGLLLVFFLARHQSGQDVLFTHAAFGLSPIDRVAHDVSLSCD